MEKRVSDEDEAVNNTLTKCRKLRQSVDGAGYGTCKVCMNMAAKEYA